MKTTKWVSRFPIAATAVLLSASSSLYSEPVCAEEVPATQQQWNLTSLQGGMTFAHQGGGSSLSLIGRYTPEYFFTGNSALTNFSVGLNLGVTAFNNVGAPNFLALEYGLFGGYRFNDVWDARLLMGGQTWTQGNGSAFFVGAEPLYHFRFEKLPLLDAAFVSYEAVFLSTLAHELSAGIQLKF